jgi:hypothetical protein
MEENKVNKVVDEMIQKELKANIEQLVILQQANELIATLKAERELFKQQRNEYIRLVDLFHIKAPTAVIEEVYAIAHAKEKEGKK